LLDWESTQLPTILQTSDNQRLFFVKAFIASAFYARRWTFVNQVPVAAWSGPQIAMFACCLPFGKEVWQWLEQFGPDNAHEYWRIVPPPFRRLNLEEVRIATTSLIAVGRGFAAIRVLFSARHEKLALPSDLIAEILEAAFSPQNSDMPDRSGHVHYSVQQLVKLLQEDTSFDRFRLASIEWGLLAFLDPEFNEVGPDTLFSVINSEPTIFVELLKKVYRGENDPPGEQPMTEQDQLIARHANRLLDGLRRLPGTTEDGTFDYDFVRNWVKEVQSLAAKSDRIAMCDLTLGQLFGRALQKNEGIWPSHEMAMLMEEIGPNEFFDGFVNGVLNSRGAVSRDPRAGGDLERGLIEKYRQLAQEARPSSRKLAGAFLRLADHYEDYAQHEDVRADRDRVGR
jgi:hypothetical protein